ncbi:hypothetical protein M9H77_12166 [Catharanthus roseus]|uniref:Uncharacterized protein n=1 Tax=Catharanthus roseus TaxID=4058 RepID=A0ACC0BGS6_CATRO|nr:hypothetical protein M9H77_12166 [Catharanthus roseus]
MQRSFTLLLLANRLHSHISSELHATYSTFWVAHSSVIRGQHYTCETVATFAGCEFCLEAFRVDAKELAGCWSLLKAWIYLYFPMFAPSLRHSSEGCKPYIQMFPTIGYNNENKLLDIRLRLDMITADEAVYSAHPIQPQEARRPPNNRMYILRNTFVEALSLEAPSHLLTDSWTSVLAIPASSCTDDYMDWYLPCTHPMIQNPRNIPSGYNVPVALAIPPKALLDLIARECHRQDIDGDELRRTV